MERRRRLSSQHLNAVKFDEPSVSGAFDLVAGLVSHIASGKDVFCERASLCGFRSIRTSDVIRSVLAEKGITDPTREQLQDEGNRGRRVSGDGGYWQKIMVGMAEKNGWRRPICNGIRNPAEVEALQEKLGGRFVLIGITAPFDVRWARVLKRRQAGDGTDSGEFKRRDDRDRGVGEPKDGQQVDETMKMVASENLYDNVGTLDEYHAWIDATLARLLSGR